MPVHSREKKESNHEEMEVDFAEQEGSTSEDEDTESSSVSEDGESSGANHSHLYLSGVNDIWYIYLSNNETIINNFEELLVPVWQRLQVSWQSTSLTEPDSVTSNLL